MNLYLISTQKAPFITVTMLPQYRKLLLRSLTFIEGGVYVFLCIHAVQVACLWFKAFGPRGGERTSDL